jgi:hypothetical protein
MRTLLLLASVTALFTFNPTFAYAQPAQANRADQRDSAKEQARKLAEQGFDASEAGNYKAAAQFFRQADERFHAITLVLLQGHALAKSGSLLEARALYERVINEKLPAGAPKEFIDAKAEAKTALQELNKRIPTLRIDVRDAPAGARVTIDGVEVPASEWNRPIAREPRALTITGAATGHEPVTRSVTLKEGAHESVTLTFPTAEPSSVPLAPDPAAPSAHPPLASAPIVSSNRPPMAKGHSGFSPIPAAVALSFGGVGVVTGLVTGAMWRSKDNDIRSQCEGDICPARLQPEIDRAKALGRIAVAGFVVGGVGLGVGITLIALSGSKSSSDPTATTTLLVGPGSLAVKGSF